MTKREQALIELMTDAATCTSRKKASKILNKAIKLTNPK